MGVDWAVAEAWGLLAATAVAAGYVVATRRRSRRAAGLCLAGLGLVALAPVEGLSGADLRGQLLQAGLSRAWAYRVMLWGHAVQWAAAYGLLAWAVVADRAPPADD